MSAPQRPRAGDDARLAVLQECQRILVAEGGASLTLAMSWCITDDEALNHMAPTQWLTAGGDPSRLLTIARRDASRLAQ